MSRIRAFSVIVLVLYLGAFGTVSCHDGLGPTAQAQIRKGPYLIYPGNSTSMTVLWQTDRTPAQATIEWGSTTDYHSTVTVLENGNGEDEHQFSYTITDLTPGSRTYYQVSVDGEQFPGSFLTAPSESATSLTFYAYGDTRSHPDIHDSVISQLMADLNTNPDERQTFCLHVGDFVTFGLDEAYWDDEYFNRNYTDTMTFLSSLPVMGTIGDHETFDTDTYTPDYEHAGELYRKYWPYPLYPDTKHFYYSFDYGPAHVCVLDQYTAEYTKGSTQYAWAEQDLSNSTKPWKVVMFHDPAWSAYGIEGPDVGPHENDEIVQSDLCPLFENNGVTVVVQGHNHYYARCTVNGIQYLALGGGGADPYPPAPNQSNVGKAIQAYHFAKFDISGNTMSVSVISNEGEKIDSFTVNKSEETIGKVETKMVHVGDIDIAYKMFGEGDPLLLIMGYSCTMDLWPPEVLQELATHYKVIIFDNRGMGETTASDKVFTIELFADDTAGLLDALNIERAHVLGWSMGTIIAQQLVLDHPDKVDKLILYAAYCGGKEAIWLSRKVLIMLVDTSGTPEEQGERLLKLLFPQEWLEEHPDPSTYFPMPTETSSPENVERQYEAMGSWYGTFSQLPQITQDTLLITGTDDILMPPENSFIIAQQIPGAWLVQLKGGGHGVMYQYPEKFSRIVLTFLEN